MDVAVFRFLNTGIMNPFFDAVLPAFSNKDFVVIPGVVLACVAIYFGNIRLRVGLLAALLAVGVADLGCEKVLKDYFAQHRPYAELADVHLNRANQWVMGVPFSPTIDPRRSYSFPSTHASNTASVAAALACLNPASLWVTVPLTLLVGLSRIYTGNHYPGDVLAGFVWGALCGLVVAKTSFLFAKRVWGNSWDAPAVRPAMTPSRRVFLALLAAWTLLNFAFLHLGLFDLAGDEAQYWDWSRRLALGYYSKPPLVAYVIDALAGGGGVHEWAIRTGAVLSIGGTLIFIFALTLRISRNERTALLAVIIALALPAIWAGSVIMTIDPLLCVTWAAALYYFHRAVNGEPRSWWLVGLALGLGMLGKYTILFLVAIMAIYLVIFDRKHLRTWGPYLALLIMIVCISGVIYWNWENDWVSVRHTASIGAGAKRTVAAALTRLAAFFGGQLGVASPIIFVLILWAVLRCARRVRADRDAALLVLGFVGIFVPYMVATWNRDPEPNWPVCAYIAGAPALAIVWRSSVRPRWQQRLLVCGLLLGCGIGLAARSSDLLYLAGSPPPPGARADRIYLGPLVIDPGKDPTNELRGGRELGAALSKLIDVNFGTFIFSDRYQLTAQAAFYTKGLPRTYCMNLGDRRFNQYDLWDDWESLKGRDGLLVTGGDPLKANLYIQHLITEGFFASGDVVKTVDVMRGATRIKGYTISRLTRYTGKPWPTPEGKY